MVEGNRFWMQFCQDANHSLKLYFLREGGNQGAACSLAVQLFTWAFYLAPADSCTGSGLLEENGNRKKLV